MRVFENATVATFVDLAERYCAVIEGARRFPAAQLLKEVERLLPQLYLASLDLPDEEPQEAHWRTQGVPHEQWVAVFSALQEVLGSYEPYREIYDPVAIADPDGASERGEEPVDVSLADDLADIWRDLRAGLNAFASANVMGRLEIVHEWRASFGFHWGQHLVDALRAIHWWLHVHHVGESDLAPEA